MKKGKTIGLEQNRLKKINAEISRMTAALNRTATRLEKLGSPLRSVRFFAWREGCLFSRCEIRYQK
jgi:hypothetical protein